MQMLRRFSLPPVRRRTTVPADPCTTPQGMNGSPLLTELQALRDHAARLGWLAAREHRPDVYQRFAADTIGLVLQGWRAQRTDGTLADLGACDAAVGLVPGGGETPKAPPAGSPR